VGQEVDADHSKAPQREPAGDQQQRGILRELPRLDLVGRRHAGERVGDDRRHAGALRDQLVEPRQQRAAATSTIWSTWL